MSANEYRPELEKVPWRMKDLPIDRGYPVPWFVDWVRNDAGETVPEFRAMDPRKWLLAVKEKRCWVCGLRLGGYLTFVIGPMCGINRTSAEPPCHLECAEWSARNCPFLSRPHMERREIELVHLKAAGEMIMRNPGVMLLWVTRDYEVYRATHGNEGYLINIGNPLAVSFWTQGRHATRAEIDASVAGGLPVLQEKLTNDEERTAFNASYKAFQELLPAA